MMSIFNEARLETWNEVKGLSDEKLNQKPSAEEWSIREVLDHLKKSIWPHKNAEGTCKGSSC